MGRLAILGNGKLTVGLNERGMVNDFYYPFVGEENLTTARSMHHGIGVWVDGKFSWLDSDQWKISIQLSSDSLTTRTKFINDELKLEIFAEDFVHHDEDYFGRKLKVFNNSESEREIRIFMHQVFEISRNGRADTALYVPESHYVLDYKGQVLLVIGGVSSDDGQGFDQYAVGNYGIEGKAGTFLDAEDGELSNHPVEHGGVDSVIRFVLNIENNEYKAVNYWVIADNNQQQASQLNTRLKTEFDELLTDHKHKWGEWLYRSGHRLDGMTESQKKLVRKSLMTIRSHCDKRGGIIASCDSSIYNYGRDYYSYVWPRDGAYVIWPLIKLGYYEEPRAFFNFCADVVSPAGYMMHKYQPDRSVGSTWHPLVHGRHSELAIQEDETAILIFMLSEYYKFSDDKTFTLDIFNRFVIKAADFLANFVDSQTGLPHASYDLWEEKFLTSTYTSAVTYRALICAVEFGKQFGETGRIQYWRKAADSMLEHFATFINPDTGGYIKGFLLDVDSGDINFDKTIDVSSIYGVMTYQFLPKNMQDSLQTTINLIEEKLLDQNDSGGTPRYEGDYYFRLSPNSPPNPWIVTTLWMAQYYLSIDNVARANELLTWAENKALSTGIMSEQINPFDSQPMSVTPLVWSHAEYINTVLAINEK